MANTKIVAIHSRDGAVLQNLSDQWLALVNPRSPATSPISPYTLVQLIGPDASRVNGPFGSIVGDPDVALITGLAHGNDSQFTGFNGEILYSAPTVPRAEVSGKIVHLLSCSTAVQLSAAFLAAQCRAFIGYSGVVPIDQNPDWVASFLLCDAQIEFSLTRGMSVAKAIQAAKDKFLANQLDYIGKMLQCQQADGSSIFLPPIQTTPPAAAIETNSIDGRDLTPPNNIPNRRILRSPAFS